MLPEIYIKQIGSSWTFCDKYGHCVHSGGVVFERNTSGLPKYKNTKKIFCSRKCNGQYYNDITNNLINKKDDKHGINMYRNGCRCEVCRMANRDKQRKYRASKK